MLAILRRWHRSSTAIWLFVRLRFATAARVRAECAANLAHAEHSKAEDRLIDVHCGPDLILPVDRDPVCRAVAVDCILAARRAKAARVRFFDAADREERLARQIATIERPS